MHFVLSIVYSPPIDLGLDPTMCSVDNSEQYDISVRADDGSVKVYRTIEILASRDPDMLFGRGTRVWKAVHIEDGQTVCEPVALKDAWVDLERMPEGTIFDKVRLVTPVEHEQPVGNFFPSVECHGDVFLNDGSSEILDCTHTFSEAGVRLDIPSISRTQRLQYLDGESPPNDNATPRISHPSAEYQKPKCLVHYRIVLREICKPLSEETSLSSIFRALAQITLGKIRLWSDEWPI